MDLDLVITGGTLLTAGDNFRADLGILDGVISAIGEGLSGRETIDARGKLVIPGGVDPHVHLEMPVGATISCDDWETGTIAAAFGGTTTVIDFIEPGDGQTLLQAFEERRSKADRRANIDFGLHMTLISDEKATLAEIPEVFKAGMTSFKMYTTYEGFRLEDNAILNALTAVRDVGGLTIVHAENDAMIDWLTQQFLDAGKTSPRYHPQSRPDLAEGEAIQRVLALAGVAKAPVYIVHVSTELGARALALYKSRGQPVFGETCPQYLLLTDDEYERPDFEGAKYVCSPPLRKARDKQALWKALAKGELQTVGTDHCPFNFHGQKDLGRDRFTNIPGGLPGIEARLALLYTYGVRQGHLTPNQWIDVCCTGPARLFGLYPRKGTLVPGADADVVLFDPQKKVTLSKSALHENVDYTPYEGMELQGVPVTTIARGEVLVRDGQYIGPKGRGQYLKRGSPEVETRLVYG